MEANVLPSPEVRRELESFIPVELYTDGKSAEAPKNQFLTDKNTNPKTAGDIKWNFTKFLIDKKGNVINRFESGVTPEAAELVKAVEAALAQ